MFPLGNGEGMFDQDMLLDRDQPFEVCGQQVAAATALPSMPGTPPRAQFGFMRNPMLPVHPDTRPIAPQQRRQRGFARYTLCNVDVLKIEIAVHF
jgi:hypothetical protein